MRLKAIAASSACLVFATTTAAPALAQGLSANEILGRLAGRWALEKQATSCEGRVLQITLSSDRTKATLENWPVGRTTIFDVERVRSILRNDPSKAFEAVALTDRSVAPPVLLTVGMSDAAKFRLSSAMPPGDQPTVFVRCAIAS